MTSVLIRVAKGSSTWPEGDTCGKCGRVKTDSHVYVMGGACFEGQYPTEGAEVFLNIGKHTSDSNGKGGFDLEILMAEETVQVDLQFCSVQCLRLYINELLDQIEILEKDS